MSYFRPIIIWTNYEQFELYYTLHANYLQFFNSILFLFPVSIFSFYNSCKSVSIQWREKKKKRWIIRKIIVTICLLCLTRPLICMHSIRSLNFFISWMCIMAFFFHFVHCIFSYEKKNGQCESTQPQRHST